MSDQATVTIEPAAEEARAWPEPNTLGYYPEDALTRIHHPGRLGALLVIEQADGWRAGYEATIADQEKAQLPRSSDWPLPTREEALANAAETLIAFCGNEKEQGSKKHRKHATDLQGWALSLGKRIASAEQIAGGGSAQEGNHEESQTQKPAEADQPEGGQGITHTYAPDGALRMIPIEELYESPWNPRQVFPEAAMQELVESMRSSGFRTWLPLMVRPIGERSEVWHSIAKPGYEIGAGHRRRRAAELAGIKLIPCVVREMSAEQFLDVLNFDNSNREDVHPLDEAAGWRVWMERTGKGTADIAARIGKSREYVWKAMKYAELIPEAREHFLANPRFGGHAILIARQPVVEQKRTLKFCLTPNWRGELPSVRELAEWLHENAYQELSDCPFDRADRGLLAGVGSCEECPKRAANIPDFEFEKEDPDADLCTDKLCYGQKLTNHLVRIKEQAAADGSIVLEISESWTTKKKGVLPSQQWERIRKGEGAAGGNVKTALVVEGRDVGQVVQVRVKAAPPSRSNRDQAAEYEKRRVEQKAKADRETGIRRAILLAVREKVSGLTRADLECLLVAGFANMAGIDELCRLHDITFKEHQSREAFRGALPKLSERDIFQLAVEATVIHELEDYDTARSPEALLAAAKRYKVDAAKIRRDMEEAAKAAEGGKRREVTPKDTGVADDAPLSAKGKRRAAAAKKALAKKPAAKKAAKPAAKKKGALAGKVAAKGDRVAWANAKRAQRAGAGEEVIVPCSHRTNPAWHPLLRYSLPWRQREWQDANGRIRACSSGRAPRAGSGTSGIG
jgi:ParB family chromosome partitioning protein